MAELLFIQPSDMVETSLMGGNIDYDKFTFQILQVQLTVIEPLLGTELYDKIIADITAATLTGIYLTIFDEFVKPITRNEAIGEYIEIGSFTFDNGGLFRNLPADAEPLSKEEVETLAQKYRAVAQVFVQRFNKFICKNLSSVPEYKTFQDEVNADRGVNLTGGWYLGQSTITRDLKNELNFFVGD